MGFKLFKCAICGADVSGRKSRVVEPHGRICMIHQEFIDHENQEKIEAEKAAQKLIEDKKVEQAMEGVQIMVIVEKIRMTAYVQGQDLYALTQAMSWRMHPHIRAKVLEQVQERGPMTDKEAEEAFAMATVMMAGPLMAKKTQTVQKERGRGNGLISPLDFEDLWRYKYVRFADGNVAFCDASSMDMSHKKIVAEYRHPILPGDRLSGQAVPPVSAGMIKVKNGKWAIVEGGSTTAELNRSENDEKYVQKAIGDKFVYDIEVSY